MVDLSNIVTPSQIESIKCGGFDIFWLDKSSAVSAKTIDALLHEEEKNHAAGMKAKGRRSEFLRSRWMMKELLSFVDKEVRSKPIEKEGGGNIVWPAGIAACLSHKSGQVAFCVADKDKFRSIGLDIEDTKRSKSHLEQKICSETESTLLRAKTNEKFNLEQMLTLVFSFKEALFKCHFPLGKKMFWFHDAEMTSIDLSAGTITARMNIDSSPETPSGHTVNGFFEFISKDKEYVVTVAYE